MTDTQVKVGVVNSVAQTWMGCGAPASAAQCQAINGLLPRFYGQIPRTADNDLYFGRLDYQLNNSNTLSASFNFLRWKSPNGIQTGLTSTTGSAINGNGDDSVAVRNGKFTWTWVPKSNFVSAFRYGLDTDREADGFDQAELGGGLGYLDVAVGGASTTLQLGPATYLPRVEPLETRNEFADDLSWTAGKHTIKFGGRLRQYHRRCQLSQQPVRLLHLSDAHRFRARLQWQHHRREELGDLFARLSAIRS